MPKRVTSLRGPIPASLRPGNTAPFEEMSQRWQLVGNTVSDLTGLRFEPQTSRSRDERVTARPTCQCRPTCHATSALHFIVVKTPKLLYEIG